MKLYKIKGFCRAINFILLTAVQYFPAELLIELSISCLTKLQVHNYTRKYPKKLILLRVYKNHLVAHFMHTVGECSSQYAGYVSQRISSWSYICGRVRLKTVEEPGLHVGLLLQLLILLLTMSGTFSCV